MEVLSPSSEGDDEGDKRRDFETLASLQAYVLAAQDAGASRFSGATPAALDATGRSLSA